MLKVTTQESIDVAQWNALQLAKRYPTLPEWIWTKTTEEAAMHMLFMAQNHTRMDLIEPAYAEITHEDVTKMLSEYVAAWQDPLNHWRNFYNEGNGKPTMLLTRAMMRMMDYQQVAQCFYS